MRNTFTYRHSDLPPVRLEIKAEIVELDVHIANLILKSQGNYRELSELADILSDALDSCQLKLSSIKIIPDDSPQPAANTMTNLPIEEQSVIFSTALSNQILMEVLQFITDAEMEDLIFDVTKQATKEMGKISDKQITECLAKFVNELKKNPERKNFNIEIETED